MGLFWRKAFVGAGVTGGLALAAAHSIVGCNRIVGDLKDRQACTIADPSTGVTSTEGTIRLTFTDQSSFQRQPVSNFKVHVCPSSDSILNCPLVRTEMDASLETDAGDDGGGEGDVLTVPVPIPFTGVIQMLPDDDDAGIGSLPSDRGNPNDYLPTLLYFTSYPLLTTGIQWDVAVLTYDNVTDLSTHLGATADLEHAGVGFFVNSACAGPSPLSAVGGPPVGAKGLTLSIDSTVGGDSAKIFYTSEGIPSPQTTETDKTGLAVVFNMPTGGQTTVRSHLGSTGQDVGSVGIFVQAGTIVQAYIGPTFAQ